MVKKRFTSGSDPAVRRVPRDQFYQFSWRPRAPSLLSKEAEADIARRLKEFSKRYDEEDSDILKQVPHLPSCFASMSHLRVAPSDKGRQGLDTCSCMALCQQTGCRSKPVYAAYLASTWAACIHVWQCVLSVVCTHGVNRRMWQLWRSGSA